MLGQTLSALVGINNFMVNFMVITWGTQLIPRHGLISIPSVLQQINSNNFHGDLISISNNFLKYKNSVDDDMNSNRGPEKDIWNLSNDNFYDPKGPLHLYLVSITRGPKIDVK